MFVVRERLYAHPVYALLQTAVRYPVAIYSWYRREEIRPLLISFVLFEKMQHDALF